MSCSWPCASASDSKAGNIFALNTRISFHAVLLMSCSDERANFDILCWNAAHHTSNVPHNERGGFLKDLRPLEPCGWQLFTKLHFIVFSRASLSERRLCIHIHIRKLPPSMLLLFLAVSASLTMFVRLASFNSALKKLLSRLSPMAYVFSC